MQGTHIRALGQENPLEKEMATQSSILAWRIPWAEEPGELQSIGLQSQTWLKQRSTHVMITVTSSGIWHVQIIDIKYNPLYSQVITKLYSLASVFQENIRVWDGGGYSWNSVKISCLKLILVLLSAADWLLRNAIFQADMWANSIAVLSLFLTERYKNGYDLNISELYSSVLGVIKEELFLLRLSAHSPGDFRKSSGNLHHDVSECLFLCNIYRLNH